jgi:hypothetical protein
MSTRREGFGLIELLMAMVMLNIGILAIVAAFSSGNAAPCTSPRVGRDASGWSGAPATVCRFPSWTRRTKLTTS